MKPNSLSDVQWPAFRFGFPNCSALKYDSNSTITQASYASLERLRRMDEYFLIDSAGTRFDLSSSEFIDRESKVGGVFAWLLGARKPIKWTCINSGAVSVEKLKQFIVDDWKRYPTVWRHTT